MKKRHAQCGMDRPVWQLGQSRGGGQRQSPKSKFQPGVFVTALGAFANLRATGSPIEVLAADTAEGGFLSSVFEESIIPAVIKQPQTEKDHGDKEAENDSSGDEIHPMKKDALQGRAEQTEPRSWRKFTKFEETNTASSKLDISKEKRAEVSFGALKISRGVLPRPVPDLRRERQALRQQVFPLQERLRLRRRLSCPCRTCACPSCSRYRRPSRTRSGPFQRRR